MNRRILLFAWGILLALSSHAEARKWTDVAGNQISADYVRIHEGEVVLRQGNRVLKCPYDQFSELDKAYIRQQMEAEREKENRRVGLSQIGGPVASEAADNGALELRTWQDIHGNKILAQYTGFIGGRVELLKDGTRVSYRYESFSPGDQVYVAQILIGEGRAEEIPKKKQEGEEGGRSGSSRGGGGYGEEDDPTANSPEPGYEVANAPKGPRHGGGMENETDYEIEDASGRSHFSPNMNHVPPQLPIGPPMSPPIPSGPSYTSTTQTVWACSNCNKELPDSVKAGDRCPHCRAYLSWMEGKDGTKTYAGQFSWNNHRLVVRLGILGFFLLMGAIGALSRR